MEALMALKEPKQVKGFNVVSDLLLISQAEAEVVAGKTIT